MKSTAQQYKGFDSHLSVTITRTQRAKLDRKAAKTGASLSVLVRRLIDDMEVSK